MACVDLIFSHFSIPLNIAEIGLIIYFLLVCSPAKSSTYENVFQVKQRSNLREKNCPKAKNPKQMRHTIKEHLLTFEQTASSLITIVTAGVGKL